MLDYIYPEEEQRFFTDREHHLELLGLSRDLLTQGIRKHLALSGFRRVGKTVILKEFLRRHLLQGLDAPVAVAYLDLPRLAFTPESFATGVCLWVPTDRWRTRERVPNSGSTRPRCQ